MGTDKSTRIFLLVAFLWGVFGLVVSAHAHTPLTRPGFENQAEWNAAVTAVVEKNDAATLREILKVGEARLDGFYSTNYAHHLQQIATKKTRLFLKVAAEFYKNDMKRALPYLVNEANGFPKKLKQRLASVPKDAPEYAHAQAFIKAAEAKVASFGAH